MREQARGGAHPVDWRIALPLPRSDFKLSRFGIFVVLYATAFLLEMVDLAEIELAEGAPEYWRYTASAAAAVCLSALLVCNPTRLSFLFFLSVVTIWVTAFRFPDVANHVNLMLFCNIALITGLLYSFARPADYPNDDAFFEMIQPVMRLIIIVTFTVAGFHKFNYDFINPEVSCIHTFSLKFYRLLFSDFLGMPTAITIGLVALGTAGLLCRHVSRPTLTSIDVGAILLPGLAIVILVSALLSVVDASAISSTKHLFIFMIAVIVLCWQLVEGPLLLHRRFQWFALCLCLLVHAQLAMIGIVDFQSLAIALLMTFVPPTVLEAWNRRRTVSLLGISMHRAHAFFLLNLIGGLAYGIGTRTQDFVNVMALGGVLFNIGLLILLWPIITDVFSRHRPWRWEGVQVLARKTPGFLYAAPVALLLFGMTSHFGLRTAGNFSMFSNLRTEGERSNHLLFGSNPLKFAGYQEDVVTVHEIDDERARIGHHYVPLEGNLLPVVEFKKLILLWREAGRVVPITFEHNGQFYRTQNIVEEPYWQVGGFDWEMRLMDFRVIQPEGPNRCAW